MKGHVSNHINGDGEVLFDLIVRFEPYYPAVMRTKLLHLDPNGTQNIGRNLYRGLLYILPGSRYSSAFTIFFVVPYHHSRLPCILSISAMSSVPLVWDIA